MATSTVPGAIDYLVAQLPLLAAFTSSAEPVVVSDGWPSSVGDDNLVIGVLPEDPDTPNVRVHAEIGARTKVEEYDIPCLIWCYRGGGDEAMKPARDAAWALLNAIDTFLRNAPGATLGGLLNSGIATVSGVSMRQTGVQTDQNERVVTIGRSCELRFTINCTSRLSA